ncbi:MAG: NAD(P)H-dependent flavin oxidoreductase [Oscillospiraceae bacterium]
MLKTIKTAATELLGIEYPILQGAMQWIATPPLVAAVSNAGGLGILSSSTYPTPEELRAAIQEIKALTDKPFAVNLSIFPAAVPPDYVGYINVCHEEGVRLMETAGRSPGELVELMKSYGMTIFHKCTTVKHALKAQSLGVDMIVADGFEAAGHPGENDIGSLVLTPRCVEALDIPVISCGGHSNGRSLAAALMLGAEGITMGTRFLVSQECPVLQSVKQFYADTVTEMDTILLLRSVTNTTRMYKSAVAKKVYELEQNKAPFEQIFPYMSGKVAAEMMFETGDIENTGTICCGETVGLIHDVPTVQEIIDRTMAECFEAIGKYQI